MVYKHAYLNTCTLLLLHSTFMLNVVKIPLKGEVVDRVLNSHGNYIVDHGKSWKNHGIVFLNFYGNPVTAHCIAIVGPPLEKPVFWCVTRYGSKQPAQLQQRARVFMRRSRGRTGGPDNPSPGKSQKYRVS